MDNHFTITIDDHNGITHFSLHKFVKKALFYLVIIVFSTIFLSVATIFYFNHNLDKIDKKNSELIEKNTLLNKTFQETQEALKLKSDELKVKIEELERQTEAFNEKRMEIHELSSSLNAIETLIGIVPDKNSSIEDRVNLTQLATEHKATILQFIPNGSPILYKGITSKYGNRIHPVLKRKEFHNGIDMRAKMNTPVYATADGVIEWSGMHKKSGYGKLVIIQHNYGFKTYYGHLNKISVKSKQFVRKGDLIAYTGNTGRSSGPHLHYEIKYFYRTVNPYWFVKWDMENYNEIFEKEKKVIWSVLVEATRGVLVPNPTNIVALTYEEEQKKHKKGK